MRKSSNYITKQSLTWNPERKTSRGKRRGTLRCELRANKKGVNSKWNQLERIAQKRV